MKRLFLFIGIITTVTLITWGLKAQTKPKETPKTYNVSLTVDQWQSVLTGLETIKNAVKTSNMPAAQATFISDSIIIVYQNEFGRQIQAQMQAEQKPKTDTTSKYKKN